MSVSNVVLRDMEENFPDGRRPSRLRERASLVRSRNVKKLLQALAEGSKHIEVDKDLEELAKSNDNASKALLLIALYYPVTLASKNIEDPYALSVLMNSRILLKIAGLEKAARNVGEILKGAGRRIVQAIVEIADPDYVLMALKAARSIGEALDDKFLIAFAERLEAILEGREASSEIALEPEEEFELRLYLSAALVVLGRYDEAKRIMSGKDPLSLFFSGILALESQDVTARGEIVATLERMGADGKLVINLLEAVKCAFRGDEKCYKERIQKAKEIASEAPDLIELITFVEKTFGEVRNEFFRLLIFKEVEV